MRWAAPCRDGQGQNFATMGIDYQYEDGQIRLVTSDFARLEHGKRF